MSPPEPRESQRLTGMLQQRSRGDLLCGAVRRARAIHSHRRPSKPGESRPRGGGDGQHSGTQSRASLACSRHSRSVPPAHQIAGSGSAEACAPPHTPPAWEARAPGVSGHAQGQGTSPGKRSARTLTRGPPGCPVRPPPCYFGARALALSWSLGPKLFVTLKIPPETSVITPRFRGR